MIPNGEAYITSMACSGGWAGIIGQLEDVVLGCERPVDYFQSFTMRIGAE